MTACGICLLPSDTPYHPACLRALFGADAAPALPFGREDLLDLGHRTIGHASISGAQPKVSVNYRPPPSCAIVPATRESPGRFILKPQSPHFAALPENEHLTMCLARAAGIPTAECGLFSLKDDSAAYIVRRFDRTDAGKLYQEDFCQLAGKPTEQKYEGSAELCARLVKHFLPAPQRAQALAGLFQQFAFAYLCGNGDLHLKNLSVLKGEGGYRLSPAYDLVSTELVLPGDQMALPLRGKRAGLTRRTFLQFAAYCDLPQEQADAILSSLAALPGSQRAEELFAGSPLPADLKDRYRQLLAERAAVLSPPPQPPSASGGT